ncbi:hypothetical protein ZIOFF_027180 [Zingiber officinale]|uniref:GDT1 family protein n=1 Tax=Zingiber officinale TaxID=94328 RepID=A0A8J5LIH2_ZINOF|nr:hypothetical protein ZIOFF_027180 [Zingiber officinale]
MGRAGTGFDLSSIALFLLIVSTCLAALAQESETDGGDKDSAVVAEPLDRRTRMLIRPLKKDDDESWEGVVSLEERGLGVFDAFFSSLSMIIVSEIGDETFIIAALMAMRHPKSIVLSGALSALVVMTVLSTGLGRIVPNLISRKHTNSAATVLYAFFGLRLLYIAWRSDSKASQKKEIEESFILTFLAEWGDRSQIATIALATHKNAIGVAVGATLGHTVCTSLAVIGGSLLASKISQRTVATIGGLLFLGFSLSSYFYPPL